MGALSEFVTAKATPSVVDLFSTTIVVLAPCAQESIEIRVKAIHDIRLHRVLHRDIPDRQYRVVGLIRVKTVCRFHREGIGSASAVVVGSTAGSR